VVDEGSLQRMQLAAGRQPLDCDDLAIAAAHGQHDARVHRLAVEEHRAHAALGVQAILFRAREPEIRAQHLQKRARRLHREVMTVTVDRQAQGHPRHHAAPRMRS
jgi:hypothetical protein